MDSYISIWILLYKVPYGSKIHMDFIWILLYRAPYGSKIHMDFIWIHMDPYGSYSIGFHMDLKFIWMSFGSIWIHMDPYGSYTIEFHMGLKFIWISFGSIWIHMKSIWIHLDLHLYFDVYTYGFVWTHMDPNGFIRIQYAFNKLFFDFLTFPCIGRCSLDGRGYKEGASMGATNANPYGSLWMASIKTVWI